MRHLQVKEFQGLPESTKSWEKQEGFSPTGFRRSVALLTPQFQTSGLHNCEGITLCYLRHPLCGPLLPGSHRKRTQHFTRCGEPHGVCSRCSPAPWLQILYSSKGLHFQELGFFPVFKNHTRPYLSSTLLCQQVAQKDQSWRQIVYLFSVMTSFVILAYHSPSWPWGSL